MMTNEELIIRGSRLLADILSEMPTKSPSPAPVVPSANAVRKGKQRAEGRTGRSAFVAEICEAHPDWEFEDGTTVIADSRTHCAKFGHLPGKGKGPVQPSAVRVLLNIGGELVKPVILISLLFGGLYGLQFVFSGGFRVNIPILQPHHGIQPTNSPMPNVSQQPTPGAVRRSSGSNSSSPASLPSPLPRNSAVKK